MTMTHKQRIKAAFCGEMPDVLPYVPRIDLWYNANFYAGKLPERHRGRTRDEISRAEGWALHKQLPDYLDVAGPEDMLHRGIGIMTPAQAIFRYRFSDNVDVRVKQDADTTRVEYHTPIGVAHTTLRFTEDLKKAGSTIPFIAEHIIRGRDDYRIVTYIFQNLELAPDYERFRRWEKETGEDGLCSAFTTHSGSPIHHIQKDLIDATAFFLHYHDFQKEMSELAEAIEQHYHQWLKIAADSPAEAVGWGANYDETITYAPYFEKEILPWLQKVSDTLHGSGKVVNTHCDGENQGLMDLIKQTRVDMAEAVCPHPMTKLTIEEYYRWWADEMTIFGGVPSNMLLSDSASDDEFEAYLDFLFKSITPGRRFVLGIADTTPPDAVFERLIRIGERVAQEAHLPMKAGTARPISESHMQKAAQRVEPRADTDDGLAEIREDVREGRDKDIQAHVRQKLDAGVPAREILNRGMLAVMEEIGAQFKDGSVFIPEVLLSARAMNAALTVLQPHLAGRVSDATGRILIGTVHGDLHDIGKNLVVTMFRGIGLEVKDLGINVATQEFVRQVTEYKPHVVGLSALLTTTMPEMKKVIEALEGAGLRDSVKVIIGGAPVNQKFARGIGADGYAKDAGEAVSLVKQMIPK